MGDFGATLAALTAAAAVATIPATFTVELLKKIPERILEPVFYPFLAIGAGMVWTWEIIRLTGPETSLEWALTAGFISGLMASGIWRSAKAVANLKR